MLFRGCLSWIGGMLVGRLKLMLKISKNAGFASFVEIVMTTGIFLITAVGIYSTIAMISPKSASSTRKLEAAYAGKTVIDRLSSQVTAESWLPGGNLALGTHPPVIVGSFTVTYNLEIPSGYGAVIPEERPRELNVRVDY